MSVARRVVKFKSYAAKSNFGFVPREDDELELLPGEAVTVIGPAHDEGWFEARNARGQTGIIPSNYITAQKEASGAPEA